MALKRSISTRANLLTWKFHPSFSYILHDDDSKAQSPNTDPSFRPIFNFTQRNFYNTNIENAASGFGAVFREKFLLSQPPVVGFSHCRYMSSTIDKGADKIEYMTDVAEVIADKTMEVVSSQAPAVSEVAIAAADSALPVAALQYLIDGVHSFTGFNWWASIALTTLLIRGATVPILISQLKSTTKLTMMRPHLEEIKQQMEDRAMDPKAVAEGQARMQALFKEYGVTPFAPFKGMLIQGPIFVSFFFAINNMVEKVPSFKSGGALWFTDLTTPDSLFIFPVLTSLTFLITVELNVQEGLEGNPVAGTMKTFSRILAVLTIPFTMSFPKAIFCYWVMSNLFSLMYGQVIKRPEVKKYLQIPEIPVTPSTKPQPAFSLFSALKRSAGVGQEPSSLPTQPSKHPEQRISSSSIISQRLRSLEKQVKGRKKNKKR